MVFCSRALKLSNWSPGVCAFIKYVPAPNVITLEAILHPETVFITLVFNVRLVQVAAVIDPPLVLTACVSLKMAVSGVL